MNKKIYLLKNKNILKTFEVSKTDLCLILWEENNSIDIIASQDIELLKSGDKKFEVLKAFRLDDLKNSGFKIPGGLSLASQLSDQKTEKSVLLDKDPDDQLIPFAKWSSIAHIGLVIFFLLFSHFYVIEKKPHEKELKLYKVTETKKTPRIQTSLGRKRSYVSSVKKKKKQRIVSRKKAARKGRKSFSKKTKKKSYSAGRTRSKNRKSKSTGRSAGVQKRKSFGSSGAAQALRKAAKSTAISKRGTRYRDVNTKVAGGEGISGLNRGSGSRFGNSGQSPDVGGYSSGPKSNSRMGRIDGSGQGLAINIPNRGRRVFGGGLEKSQVAAVIRKHQGELLYCYEKSLQRQPHLRGKISVKFTIASAGVVSFADIAHSSMQSSAVENCIVRAFKRWKFPKPHKGSKVQAQFPIDFNRLNKG